MTLLFNYMLFMSKSDLEGVFKKSAAILYSEALFLRFVKNYLFSQAHSLQEESITAEATADAPTRR